MPDGKKVGGVYIETSLDAKDFKDGVKQIQKGSKKIDKSFDKTKKSSKGLKLAIGGIIAVIGVFALRAAKQYITAISELASANEEATSKFETVFKGVKGTDEAIRELTNSYGQSRLAAVQMLGATGDLLTGMGATKEEALELSRSAARLGADLASFSNFAGGAEGATYALTKAMLGEREMVKALGIVIREDDIKRRLADQGMKDLTGSTLLQAKAQITLQMALEQSKNAIGDFGRTSTSVANQTRILQNTIMDIGIALGDVVNEVMVRDMLGNITSLLGKLRNVIVDNKDDIIKTFEDIRSTLLPLFENMKAIVENLFESMSNNVDGVDESFLSMVKTVYNLILTITDLLKKSRGVDRGFGSIVKHTSEIIKFINNLIKVFAKMASLMLKASSDSGGLGWFGKQLAWLLNPMKLITETLKVLNYALDHFFNTIEEASKKQGITRPKEVKTLKSVKKELDDINKSLEKNKEKAGETLSIYKRLRDTYKELGKRESFLYKARNKSNISTEERAKYDKELTKVQEQRTKILNQMIKIEKESSSIRIIIKMVKKRNILQRSYNRLVGEANKKQDDASKKKFEPVFAPSDLAELAKYIEKLEDTLNPLDETTKKIKELNKQKDEQIKKIMKEKNLTKEQIEKARLLNTGYGQQLNQIDNLVLAYEEMLNLGKRLKEQKIAGASVEDIKQGLGGELSIKQIEDYSDKVEAFMSGYAQELEEIKALEGDINKIDTDRELALERQIENQKIVVDELKKEVAERKKAVRQANLQKGVGLATQFMGAGVSGQSEKAQAGAGILGSIMTGFTTGGVAGGIISILTEITKMFSKFSKAFGGAFEVVFDAFETLGMVIAPLVDIVLIPLNAMLGVMIQPLQILGELFGLLSVVLEPIMNFFNLLLAPLKGLIDLISGKSAVDTAKKTIEYYDTQTKNANKQLSIQQKQLDQLKKQTEAMESVKSLTRRAAQIQDELLALEQARDKADGADLDVSLYQGLLDRMEREQLYKEGSFDIDLYRQAVGEEGEINRDLIDSLLKRLDFRELDAEDIYSPEAKAELQALLGTLKDVRMTEEEYTDKKMQLEMEYTQLQLDLQYALEITGNSAEILGEELYVLANRIASLDFSKLSEMKNISLVASPNVVDGEIKSIFATINAKIKQSKIEEVKVGAEIKTSKTSANLRSEYSAWLTDKANEAYRPDWTGKAWYGGDWPAGNWYDRGDWTALWKGDRLSSLEWKRSFLSAYGYPATMADSAGNYGVTTSLFRTGSSMTGYGDPAQVAGLVHNREAVIPDPLALKFQPEIKKLLDTGIWEGKQGDVIINTYPANYIDFINQANDELSNLGKRLVIVDNT